EKAEREQPKVLLNVDLEESDEETRIGFSIEDSEGRSLRTEDVMNENFLNALPETLAKGARNTILFRAVYGANAPARLLGFLTEDGLLERLRGLTDDRDYAIETAQRILSLIKS
ncbi:MAG: hypothetical protein ACYTHN_23250, partial [Planctomycetota bacterium]